LNRPRSIDLIILMVLHVREYGLKKIMDDVFRNVYS
jgi:hypothetical protein